MSQEVTQRDVDYVRYDLERKIEDQASCIARLESAIRSLQDDNSSLWEAISDIRSGQ